MLLKKIGSRVLDLIYPPVCVLCGEYSAGEHLCPRCAASLESFRSEVRGDVQLAGAWKIEIRDKKTPERISAAGVFYAVI